MRNNDAHLAREDARKAMMEAFNNNDQEAYFQALDGMFAAVGEEVRVQYEEQMKEMTSAGDQAILAQRGVRMLTSEEKKYYQKLGEATRSTDPKQAISNIPMPETIINAVFDELESSHPLLSRVSFTPTGGSVRMLLNTNGYQKAQWGKLCDEVVKEAISGFKEVDTSLDKLSAFVPVCKAMLDLGYEWLDSFVRQVLYEMLANGLEDGIINGTGKDQPIGMIRDVSESAQVVSGVYPEKEKVAVNALDPATIGKLLSLLATDPNGKSREVRDIVLLVNPTDYFQKVFPATTLLAPDGTYRNDVLPYPMTVIQSAAVKPNTAVLGMGYQYFAAAGMDKAGQIEFSDHYQFLEDARVYLIKLYANGFPVDNNAFLHLDISGLRPAVVKVEQVTAPSASADATLSSLKIGALALSPTFAAATVTYTAETTNASNAVTAVPSDAAAEIAITVNEETLPNGEAANWKSGSNTVKVVVTAEDGTTKKTYTVTVTKS